MAREELKTRSRRASLDHVPHFIRFLTVATLARANDVRHRAPRLEGPIVLPADAEEHELGDVAEVKADAAAIGTVQPPVFLGHDELIEELRVALLNKFMDRSRSRVAKIAFIGAPESGAFRQMLCFDRLTPAERLRAMAALAAGPSRSGDIAAKYGTGVESAAPIRSSLIKKGMIFSPAHGDTAFTVPLFDEFMRRAVPDDVATPSNRQRRNR